jgi:triosephosphate isomerase
VEEVDVVLCPPFTALARVGESLANSRIALGAQNVNGEPRGAFTGEISASMLVDCGCRFCIVGHSERRQVFGETDESIHRKLLSALSHGLKGILCVGETLPERQGNQTWNVVERQLKTALDGIEPQLKETSLALRIIIAYEPVWAIGTGRNATPIQVQEVHGAIRSWLARRWGQEGADSVRIQYGGSVRPENTDELMAQPDVDGVLVGGASLDPQAFVSIVKSVAQRKGTR